MQEIQETHLTKVTSPLLLECLKVARSVNRPIFLWGDPGLGKSAVIRQFSQWLEDEHALDGGVHMVDVRASQLDSLDLRGLPLIDREDGEAPNTVWAKPNFLPTEEFASQFHTVMIFLDELNSGNQSVMAASYQLMLDRRLGDYKLPDNVFIVAAGNLETNMGVTNRMPTPLAGRFAMHLQLITDFNAWQDWAVANDIHEMVLGFLNFRKDKLQDWDPKSPSKAQPNPRTWEFLSDMLHDLDAVPRSEQVESAVVTGCIGAGAGTEMLAFMEIYRDLPDMDEVMADPENATIPGGNQLNVLYAFIMSLVASAEKSNAEAVLTLVDRIEQVAGMEFSTLLIRTVARRKPEVAKTKQYVKWATENAEKYVEL